MPSINNVSNQLTTNIVPVQGTFDQNGNVINLIGPAGKTFIAPIASTTAVLSLDANGNPVGIVNPKSLTPITGFSTLRDKIRKAYSDAVSKPYFSSFWNLPEAWLTGQTIAAGECRSSNGNWYIALAGGTTGLYAPNLLNPLLTQPYSSWYDGAIDGSGTSGVRWSYYSLAQPVYTGDVSTSVTVTFSATSDASVTNVYTPLTGNYGTPTSFTKSAQTNSTKQFIPVGAGSTAEFATWVGDLIKSPGASSIIVGQTSGGALGIRESVGNKDSVYLIDIGHWELNTDSAKLQFATDQFSAGFQTRVLVDNVEVSPTAFICPAATKSGLGNANLYTLISLAGPKKVRNIKIFQTNGLRDVRVQANASLYYVQDQPLSIMWVGDSISAGSAEGPSRPNMPWPVITANKLGIKDLCNASVGGTGFENSGSGFNFLQRLTQATSSTSGPPNSVQYSASTSVFDIVVIQASGNDGVGSTTLQAQQLATFQAARALQPNALIIIHGAYPGTGSYNTAASYCDGKAQLAFAQWNDPNSVYIQTLTSAPGGQWLTGSGYSKVGFTSATGNSSFFVGSDSLHPLDAGINFLGQQTYNAIKTILAI